MTDGSGASNILAEEEKTAEIPVMMTSSLSDTSDP